jgi:hypothetical protein
MILLQLLNTVGDVISRLKGSNFGEGWIWGFKLKPDPRSFPLLHLTALNRVTGYRGTIHNYLGSTSLGSTPHRLVGVASTPKFKP